MNVDGGRQRLRSKQAVLAVASMVVAYPRHGAALELCSAENSRTLIVVPDVALPVQQAAASELQYYVKKSCGAELTIVRESEVRSRPASVYIGLTRAAGDLGLGVPPSVPNGFVIKRINNVLFILGDDSDGPVYGVQHENRTRVGSLFGVYEFLERQLGVLWLWPGELGEVVPRRPKIVVDNWDTHGRPSHVHARWRDGGSTVAGIDGWPSPALREKYLDDQGKWLRHHRFAMALNMNMSHAYTNWWDRYSASHPEYFNLLPDGSRRPDPNYQGGEKSLVSMSVGDPGLWQEKVADWYSHRTSDAPYLDASENDTAGRCVCDACLALDESERGSDAFAGRVERARARFLASDPEWVSELGSLSDRYARYYLALQKEAERYDSQAVVMGYAYANYTEPPRNTKLNERIVIGVVPSIMFPWTEAKREAFRNQWNGWASTGARLFLRPNYMLDGHNLPLFIARKLGEDFRFAASHGLMGIDFDSLTGQWATQGPNLYMLARLQQSPQLEVDEILGEYYSGFGAASPWVRRYFEHWEAVSNSVTAEQARGVGVEWASFYQSAESIFVPKVMAAGKALLSAAMAAVRRDSVEFRRVAFLESGLRHAELTLATQRLSEALRHGGRYRKYADSLNELLRFRSKASSEGPVNLGFLSSREARSWDRGLAGVWGATGVRLRDPWHFKWDPEAKGIASSWYASTLDTSSWQIADTDRPWDEQDIGKRWKGKHGSDYKGYAWYRKSFIVPSSNRSVTYALVFGAVDEACTVWVNGEQVLERPYPYRGNPNSWQDAFSVDVTKYVRINRSNLVAVRVENRIGVGGIFKSVWLSWQASE